MELWASKRKAWDELPADLQAIVDSRSPLTLIIWTPLPWKSGRCSTSPSRNGEHVLRVQRSEEVTRITNEFTLPYLDKISEEQGKKDPRVIKAIEIIKQFMKDYGYIK